MTNTTPVRPRKVKRRYVDPRVVRQMAADVHATGKVSGDIEGALQELVEQRKLTPLVRYEDIKAPADISGNIRVEVGDLIAWSFKVDGTGSRHVYEVKSIVNRHSHQPRVHPHWGIDEVIATSLLTGKDNHQHIGSWYRKVKLI